SACRREPWPVEHRRLRQEPDQPTRHRAGEHLPELRTGRRGTQSGHRQDGRQRDDHHAAHVRYFGQQEFLSQGQTRCKRWLASRMQCARHARRKYRMPCSNVDPVERPIRHRRHVMLKRFASLLLLAGLCAPCLAQVPSAVANPPAPATSTTQPATSAPPAGAATPAEAGAMPSLNAQDLGTFFDGLVPYMLQRNDIAGGAVAVVKDGKLIFAQGYGYADVAKRTPVV